MAKTQINISVLASLDVEVNLVISDGPPLTVYPVPTAKEVVQEQEAEERNPNVSNCDVPGAPSKV